jgi:AcrR family transcriptional regulator
VLNDVYLFAESGLARVRVPSRVANEIGAAMSNRQVKSRVSRIPASAAGVSALRHSGSPRQRPALLAAEFQRARILRSAVEDAAERGHSGASVGSIVARAHVSRNSFYGLFTSLDDCLQAAFDEAVAQLELLVGAPVYGGEGTWAQRTRATLVALLSSLQQDRALAVFLLGYINAGRATNRQARAWLFKRLAAIVDEGRLAGVPRYERSPATAEVVVGGMIAVLEGSLHERSWLPTALTNSLMWMIVLPYLGPIVAGKELERTPPKLPATSPDPAPTALHGLDMRITYRTSNTLTVIGENPGASNLELSRIAGIADLGQTSKLLWRLASLGLAENRRPGGLTGTANAWHLTERGAEVDLLIRRKIALRHRREPNARR